MGRAGGVGSSQDAPDYQGSRELNAETRICFGMAGVEVDGTISPFGVQGGGARIVLLDNLP